jgi:hypothetical protein
MMMHMVVKNMNYDQKKNLKEFQNLHILTCFCISCYFILDNFLSYYTLHSQLVIHIFVIQQVDNSSCDVFLRTYATNDVFKVDIEKSQYVLPQM